MKPHNVPHNRNPLQYFAATIDFIRLTSEISTSGHMRDSYLVISGHTRDSYLVIH